MSLEESVYYAEYHSVMLELETELSSEKDKPINYNTDVRPILDSKGKANSKGGIVVVRVRVHPDSNQDSRSNQ